MTSTLESSRQSVAVIGPKFGTASQAIDEAIRNHVGDENVESLWYEESAFERPLGRLIGRLVRLVLQVVPLPQRIRSATEWFIGSVRFRRKVSVTQQLAWVESIGSVDHLVLVKPMFLRRNDLAKLRQTTGAATISMVLWDALWRTPSIRGFQSQTRVFSTELTDCKTFGFTALPVPTFDCFKNSELEPGSYEVAVGTRAPNLVSPSSSQPIRLFFCGSWSLDRWLAARRLIAQVRLLENDFTEQQPPDLMTRGLFNCDVHLVTTNPLVAWVTRLSPASSRSLSAAEYHEEVKQCDVLIDFGRTGQSSPSERLGTAAENGKLLLTTNPLLALVGLPVVAIEGKNWKEGLMSCHRVVRQGTSVPHLWKENASAMANVITLDGWATAVLTSSKFQTIPTSKESGQKVSEPPFSFSQNVSKTSEQIPV
jgi:hypothetical protein